MSKREHRHFDEDLSAVEYYERGAFRARFAPKEESPREACKLSDIGFHRSFSFRIQRAGYLHGNQAKTGRWSSSRDFYSRVCLPYAAATFPLSWPRSKLGHTLGVPRPPAVPGSCPRRLVKINQSSFFSHVFFLGSTRDRASVCPEETLAFAIAALCPVSGIIFLISTNTAYVSRRILGNFLCLETRRKLIFYLHRLKAISRNVPNLSTIICSFECLVRRISRR